MGQPKIPADVKYKRARAICQQSQKTTPPALSPEPGEATLAGTRQLRLRRVNRNQVTPVPAVLEALLPKDHLARQIWNWVDQQADLRAIYETIAVVEGGPGQAATDPKILATLWLYATSQGVTSARELTRLCVEHLAYIWICGGVSMNYHTLSDFRVTHAQALDNLLTQLTKDLQQADLAALENVAQDGIRVRASAGAASFHRQPTLEKQLAEAQAALAALETPSASETASLSARQQAARQRAARERVERLEAALAELPAVQAAKDADKKDEARVSSTDPQARVMKMPDGGFRPAYNVQLATDTKRLVITGVDVTNAGSDQAEMSPMADQVQERCDRLPDNWLMDGSFVNKKAIETGSAKGMCMVAPVPEAKDKDRDPARALPTDSPAVAEWRERMATAEAKETYKLRAATSECVNAQARSSHGLLQFRVRGLGKVLCVALWIALTHNLLIWLRHLPLVT
jgi:transposase